MHISQAKFGSYRGAGSSSQYHGTSTWKMGGSVRFTYVCEARAEWASICSQDYKKKGCHLQLLLKPKVHPMTYLVPGILQHYNYSTVTPMPKPSPYTTTNTPFYWKFEQEKQKHPLLIYFFPGNLYMNIIKSNTTRERSNQNQICSLKTLEQPDFLCV